MTRVLALVAAAWLAAGGASAQTWPTKAVNIVVTLPAGSATDIIGRAIGERLSQQIGQRVIVENRPGASGSIGLAAVAKSEADGHTLAIASSSWSVLPATMPNLSFDPIGDLAGITILASVPNILVVRPDSKFKSAQELVAFSKANPGKLNFAIVGQGSATHLNSARFQLSAGLNDVAVPFRGTAQALTDLIGGRVDYCFCPVSPVLPFVNDGKLVALASGSIRRSSALPDVKTTEELGFANSAYEFWVGMGVPRKTPPEIVRRVHEEIVKALNTPDIQKLWASLGQDFVISTPEEFEAYLKREAVSNAELVKAANITIN